MLMDYVQRGGPVMYPLVVCSIVALTVITERLFFWTRLRRAQEPDTVSRCLRLAQAGRYAEAAALAQSSADPGLRVLARGLLDRASTPTLSMEQQAREEVGHANRYLAVLDTTITVAPLLGIYGTLTGIIRAFDSLSAGGLPDARVVGAGIAEALITTIAGLTIAIPGIILYNHFLRLVERFTQTIEHQATTLEVVLTQHRHQTQAEPILQ